MRSRRCSVILVIIFSIVLMLPVFTLSQSKMPIDTFTYVDHNLPESYNPITTNDPASQKLSSLIHSGLVMYGLGSQVIPVLVKSTGKPVHSDILSIESCGCVNRTEGQGDDEVYTFTLKDNIIRHDGQKLAASDVKDFYDLFERKDNRRTGNNFLLSYLKNVTVEGNNISFTIRKGINPLELFTMPVIPRSTIGEGNNNGRVGVGFYRYDSKKIDRISLKRFIPSPELERPINTIECVRTTLPRMDRNALIGGQIDFIPDLPYNHAQYVAENPEVSLYPYTQNNILAIAVNMSRNYLSKNVRTALFLALDRKDLRDNAFPTSGLVNGPLTPASPLYIDLPYRERDMVAAKRLLKEANFNRTINLKVPRSRLNDSEFERFINQIVSQWKQAGINVRVENIDDDRFQKDVFLDKNYDLALVSKYFSRSFFIRPYYVSKGENNITGFNNKTIDRLFERASVERDMATIRSLYADIQTIISEELPYIDLLEERKYAAFSRRINTKGLITSDNLFGSVYKWEVSP